MRDIGQGDFADLKTGLTGVEFFLEIFEVLASDLPSLVIAKNIEKGVYSRE